MNSKQFHPLTAHLLVAGCSSLTQILRNQFTAFKPFCLLIYVFVWLPSLFTPSAADAAPKCGALCDVLPKTYAALRARYSTEPLVFPNAQSSDSKAAGLKLICWSNPEDKAAIGASQLLTIQAPLSTVQGIIDDFPDYAQLFPGLVKVEAFPETDHPETSHKAPGAGHEPSPGNGGDNKKNLNLRVVWTEKPPFILVGKIVHELVYELDSPSATSRVYRYSLKKSEYLKYSEGLIILSAIGPSVTNMLEIDFYDADWGMLRTLGSSKIWRENLEQLAISDWAVKLKAEKPQTADAEIQKQAIKIVDGMNFDACLNNRHELTDKSNLLTGEK